MAKVRSLLVLDIDEEKNRFYRIESHQNMISPQYNLIEEITFGQSKLKYLT